MEHIDTIANVGNFSTLVVSLELFEAYLLSQALHGKIGVHQHLGYVGQIFALPTQFYSQYTNRLLCQPESSSGNKIVPELPQRNSGTACFKHPFSHPS